MIYTVTLNPTIDRTLHYPKLVLGELNRASAARTDLSGKGVNVSVALRQLGVESTMIGLAAGVTGQVLVEQLRAQGYACDFVAMPHGEVRSNITVIDDATGVTTKLNEPGPTVAEADLLAFEQRLRQCLAQGDVCIFSGSLPPGAPADTYARLIRVTHAQGALAVLDSSGPAMRAGCAAAPDWIKPNDVEAAEIIGEPPEALREPRHVVQALKAMLALGPRRILLTLGARGAVYAETQANDHAEIWWGQPPQITEVSAVGAGDASLAGGVYAWQQSHPAEEIVRWAVAAGTATAGEDGTSIPPMARIRQVYEQVSVIGL
jgi:1-phosphofructokinase